MSAFTEHAGFRKRFFAFLIDKFVITLLTILVGIGIIVFHVVIHEMNPQEVQDQLSGYFIYIIYGLTAGYYVVMESSSKQATIGKMVMKLTVTDYNGQRISVGRALLRHMASYLSMLIACVGYFMIGFTQNRQGLHDMLVSTFVVDAPPEAF